MPHFDMEEKNIRLHNDEYKKLMWDYTLSPDVFLHILLGEKTVGWFTQSWAIARVLENLDYYRALDLVELETLARKWDEVKNKIHNASIRRGYEFVLQRNAVSIAR